MFKKLAAAANRPKKPITKKLILVFLRYQILWLGIAFVFAILDLVGVMALPARSILWCLFLSLGHVLFLYVELTEVGVEGSEPVSKTAAL